MPKTVIVLGGGIGGMSAAHELVERGFSVRVLERRDVPGGKARSVVVPSTVPVQNVGAVYLGRLTAPTRRDLPGEHGFRFFPRFYKHIIDTMARTPYRGSRSVAENLVDTTGTIFARFGRRALKLPTTTPSTVPELFTLVTDLESLYGTELGISPEDFAFFGERIWQILTSCSERRLDEYEKIGWWDFIGAADRSEAYQKFFGIGPTRSLVAAQARVASTKTIGDLGVQLLFNLSEPAISTDRVLNGPTNDVWIDPWLAYLRERGVDYQLNTRVHSIEMDGGVVGGVTVEHDGVITELHADYYVSALPIDVMATIVTDQVVRADPRLADIFQLSKNTAWMNGIQFYLDVDVPIGRGHQLYVDSPWALTSVSQAQFWSDVDLSRFGDGNIRGVISVVISDWDAPGLNGKPARECTRAEIRDEVWDQLARSLNVQGARVLDYQDLVHWYLDLDVDPLLKSNAEPMFVNLVDTWRLRPQPVTAIPNLFLAADYVQTVTDLATMEAANEAARRAVNGILEHSGSDASPCRLWNLHEPELLEPWRANDRARYLRGLPWDDTGVRLGLSALAALYSGSRALEDSIVNAVSSATHVEDLLTYLRTGESRSDLLQRLTSEPGAPSFDLLRAFAALTRATGSPVSSLATSTLEALSSTGRDLPKPQVSRIAPGSVRFVEP
ncbi:hydroxysqualene dehydroxylase [Microlunatus ginsengisoli]|uniref:FAD-dependent oxidoreductase n=1 Tax=Microlunatus ginsengisoli TaxID=363863 RepID=A0ABP7A9L0_9ACTN